MRKIQGGVLLGYPDRKCRRAYVQTEDSHTLVIGTTRGFSHSGYWHNPVR